MAPLAESSMICPVLIGRTAQLDALDRRLESAHDGRGQVVLIAGEAGIGKSRLVAEAQARAVEQAFAIVQGRCFEPDRALPYAPLLDLLRAHLGAPARRARPFGATPSRPAARVRRVAHPHARPRSGAPSYRAGVRAFLLVSVEFAVAACCGRGSALER